MSNVPQNSASSTKGGTATSPGVVSLETFPTRAGTADEGPKFEALTIANICFDLIFNDDISDFSLSTNHNKMGALDDIVLEVMYKNKVKKRFAMQLKYKFRLKTLTREKLLAEQGAHSLKKYFDDYQKLKAGNLASILLTRAQFDADKMKKDKLPFQGVDLVLKDKNPGFPFLQNMQCYQFQTQNNDDCEKFFENFFLYTTEASVDDISGDIARKFYSKFEKSGQFYIDFIRTWHSKNTQTKIKLNKTFLKQVMVLGLLDSSIQSLSFNGSPSADRLLFLQATLGFTVTHVSKDRLEDIVAVGNDIIGELPVTEACRVTLRDYQLRQDLSTKKLTDEERTRLLWLAEKYPLIVTDSAIVRKTIVNLGQDMKFIVLSKSLDPLRQVTTFCNLSNLERTSDIYNKMTSKFECKFQGKSIKLKTLMSISDEISKHISTNALIIMTKNSLDIGASTETLPPSHTDRFLTQNILDAGILDNVEENTMLLITCLPNTENELKTRYRLKEDVIITEKNFSINQFENFCLKYPKKECHHLRLTKENRIEWVRSNCSTIKLKKYLSNKDCFRTEKDLQRYEDDASVNIVCGGPGMGKSTLMKNFYNHATIELWTIFLYVRNHFNYFVKNGDNVDDFQKYILAEYKPVLKPFEYKLLEIFMKNGRLRILWDGMDELSDNNFCIVKSLIHQLAQNGSKHWLTSRDNMKNDLEEDFKVISRRLKPFDEDEQKQYIHSRLKDSAEDTSLIFNIIKDNVKLFTNNNILEIPLQIYLLTELFVQDPKKYSLLLKGVFTIADLYKHFVQEKFNIYFKEKKNIDTEDMNIVWTRMYEDYHQKIAMLVYFDDTQLGHLDINWDHALNQERIIEKLGFIVKITKGNLPEFFHNSFGEYFAACYIANHCSEISHFIDFFFDEKYKNIRFFFDLIVLPEECLAHKFVLYQNWHLLATCEENQFTREDKEGRDPLQVMCSWGSQNHSTDLERRKNLYILYQSLANLKSEIKKNREYIQNLELLSEKCVPSRHDKLYQLNAFSYACKSKCYLSLGVVTSTCNTTPPEEFKTNENDVFFYCLMNDYSPVLDLIEIIPKVQLKIDNKIFEIEHIMTLFNSIKFTEKILNTYALRKQVNFNILDGDGKGPIHHACENGSLEIVKLLKEHGVDLNISDNYGRRPIHYASINGFVEIVNFFIKNRVNVDVIDKDKSTPIHFACKNCHVQIVDLFLENRINAHVSDKDGKTPMHYACMKGYYEIVQLLIRHNVEVNVCDNCLLTPIHYACRNGHFKVVELLLHENVNIEAEDENLKRPIHLACEHGHLDIVNLLLGQNVIADAADNTQSRPIHIACRIRHSGIVKALIDKGVDANVPSEHELRPIHYACKNGDAETIKLFVEKKVDLEALDKFGKRPIHYVCEDGHFHIAQLLIQGGVNVNIPDQDFNNATPLHHACRNKHYDIVKLLVENGANVNVEDRGKKRPIHYACEDGRQEIVEILIERNVDVNVLDMFRKKPVDYARMHGHVRIVNLLSIFE